MRILLVHQQSPMGRAFRRFLEQQQVLVEEVQEALQVLPRLMFESYDVALFWYQQSGRSVQDLCQDLRRRKVLTPLVVYGSDEFCAGQRVEVLDSGADDAITTLCPFSELFARMKAVSRRQHLWQPDVLEVDGVSVDLSERCLRKEGVTLRLSPKEFALLDCLARHRGKVLERSFLSSRVWGFEKEHSSNVVDVHMGRLRKKIVTSFGVSLIQTCRGEGYFIASPEECTSPLGSKR